MDFFVMYIFPALVGVVVGIMSGMLGIGGGTVLVPIFRLVFGLPAISATATSLFTIIPTSVSGAATHLRNRTCIPALGLTLGIGGACTSPAGVYLASISPDWLIMLVAALVIVYSAFNMFKKAIAIGKPKKEASTKPKAQTAPAAEAKSSDVSWFTEGLTKKQLAIGVAIGFIAGLMSGYVGVGGGFIMVPLMLIFIGLPMKKASGTSLIAVMLLAIPGAISQALLGNIQFAIGIAVVVGSIPGAVLGARAQKRIPERQLRFIFGGFLVFAAILLIAKEAGLL